MTQPPGWLITGTITLSILAVSTAAPVIRLAGGAPPIAIAFWRLLDATLILAPLALLFARRDLASLSRRDWLGLLGVGVILGLHFATWIASVGLTSVAASVVLVTLHPVFVGFASHRLFGEGPRPLGWVGIAVALGGGLLIAGGDARGGTAPLLGDALALAGALCAALYFLAGRRYRQRLSLLAYVTPVYAGATVTLAVLLVALPAPWGGGLGTYGAANQGLFLALALGPMILGHTGLNWALKYVRAPVIATTIVGEPLGASLLAFLIPQIHEVPPATTLLGGAIVLAGILLVGLDEARRDRPLAEGWGSEAG
jgi:drug/metabolite transporter (DMT)-like permease